MLVKERGGATRLIQFTFIFTPRCQLCSKPCNCSEQPRRGTMIAVPQMGTFSLLSLAHSHREYPFLLPSKAHCVHAMFTNYHEIPPTKEGLHGCNELMKVFNSPNNHFRKNVIWFRNLEGKWSLKILPTLRYNSLKKQTNKKKNPRQKQKQKLYI